MRQFAPFVFPGPDVIRLRNVALRRGEKLLLLDAQLMVHAGQKLGVVGPNGCGKTSLFAMLCGELHADAEQALLDRGSRPADLWGANYYPGQGREGCVEFTSPINIRPARGNPGMEIGDPAIRERIRAITFALVGEGEAL